MASDLGRAPHGAADLVAVSSVGGTCLEAVGAVGGAGRNARLGRTACGHTH